MSTKFIFNQYTGNFPIVATLKVSILIDWKSLHRSICNKNYRSTGF